MKKNKETKFEEFITNLSITFGIISVAIVASMLTYITYMFPLVRYAMLGLLALYFIVHVVRRKFINNVKKNKVIPRTYADTLKQTRGWWCMRTP